MSTLHLDVPADRDDLLRLADTVAGAVTLPGDPDWDTARRAWNLTADLHPDAVVRPATPADVVATVRHAARTGRRVALQATGHGAGPMGALDRAVLVRTDALRGVVVDPITRRARLAAGTLARPLVDAAAEHGLAFLAGSSPDVGVVGYTLGGGVGWLGRRYGLACNSVVAAQVVTADGEVRRIDHEHDPDLFWALRGGGGSFAAVTELEVELVPVRTVHAGSLAWPLARAAEVLPAWRDWCGDVPDDVTSTARLLRYPASPDLPSHLRGQQLVVIEAGILGSERTASPWLRALRALQPTSDTFATVPAPHLGRLHGDPEQPVPALGDHRLLRSLSDAAIEAVLRIAGPGVDTPLLCVDLRQLGGSLGRSQPGNGVLDRIDATYALFAVGLPVDDAVAEALTEQFGQLRAALAPWDAGTEYLNFAERHVDAAQLFGEHRYARLQRVRASYDPGELFLANHPIPAAG
jgi:hypothetical protein